MYTTLCSRAVKVREIERVREDVAGLRGGIGRHERSVREAQARLERAAQALRNTHEARCAASLSVEKLAELTEIERAGRSQDMERREEREADEAVSAGRVGNFRNPFKEIEPE